MSGLHTQPTIVLGSAKALALQVSQNARDQVALDRPATGCRFHLVDAHHGISKRHPRRLPIARCQQHTHDMRALLTTRTLKLGLATIARRSPRRIGQRLLKIRTIIQQRVIPRARRVGIIERHGKGVLQIAHGVAEHILRYDDFARYLNDRGILVAGHDHLGHGKSLPEGGTPVYFGDGSTWETVVDDIHLLHDRLREQYPDLPILLMGHSMGSFLSRSYLIRYPGTVDAAIIMGTGWQPEMTIRGGLLLAGILSGLKGPDAVSKMVTNMAFGAYNKAFGDKPRTPNDWLSADTDNVDRYMADPLCGADATVGLFRQMLRGLRFNQTPGNIDRMDKNAPILLIAGQDDPVGNMGAGVRRTHDAFKRAGIKDVTLKLYPGLRHEILNEAAMRDTVYGDIGAWLDRVLG